MPVLYMERSSLEGLTEADIKKIIDENEGRTKYQRLEGYYVGDHDILRVVKKDSTAPNNKIVTPPWAISSASRWSTPARMTLFWPPCRTSSIITMSRTKTRRWPRPAALMGTASRCFTWMRTPRCGL